MKNTVMYIATGCLRAKNLRHHIIILQDPNNIDMSRPCSVCKTNFPNAESSYSFLPLFPNPNPASLHAVGRDPDVLVNHLYRNPDAFFNHLYRDPVSPPAVILSTAKNLNPCHCEERSDVAISNINQ